jgi:hypothetical protein
MFARTKSNGAYTTGALLRAGLLGLLTGSGAVFLVRLGGRRAVDLVAGDIRPPRSRR